jgi:major vault protein
MELSTGKPKTTDKLLSTAYLCIHNNQVGDIIPFESNNHVKGKVKLSLRVNFEGETDDEMLRWFSVSNYVKYLCDHVRSLIAGMGKRNSIADIKANYVDLVRDAILGKKPATDKTSESLGRPGLFFSDNGMRVMEVEVLELTLDDPNIAKLLDQAQHESVQQLIEIGRAQADLETTKKKEQITQEKLAAQQTTKRRSLELEEQLFQDQLEFEITKIDAQLKKLTQETEIVKAREVVTDFQTQAALARGKAQADQQNAIATDEQNLQIQLLGKETEAAVARFNSAKDGLQECLVALHRDDLAAKLAEACTIERWLSGDSMTSAIGNLLSMFPTLAQFVERGAALQQKGGNGNRLTAGQTSPSRSS